MSAQQSTSSPVVVDDLNTVFEHKALTVQRATVRYEQSDGRMGEPLQRLAVNRADAAGALLFDPATNSIVLARQFRYPVYASLSDDQQYGEGGRAAWILELVAGLQEQDQSFEETVRREIREETGYEVQGELLPVATVYSTPGYSAERIAIFIAHIDTKALRGKGGGEASEGEDIEVVTLSLSAAFEMVTAGAINDAKTVIALQYLALHQAALSM